MYETLIKLGKQTDDDSAQINTLLAEVIDRVELTKEQVAIFPLRQGLSHRSATLKGLSLVVCVFTNGSRAEGTYMDEPGKELELAVPGRLNRLAQFSHSVAVDLPPALRARPTHPVEAGFGGGMAPLGPTEKTRIQRILRAEIREPRSRYMQPWWVEPEEAVPGLVISLRYERQDAHGIALRTRDLDMAFRRAGATLENYHRGERNTGWAHPTRPERGGLLVLDTRCGSYELLATVYGSLVLWATSAPVSLASLVSLAWDSAVGATRVGRWAVSKFHGSPNAGPPQLGSSHGDAEWGVKQTKALEPVKPRRRAAASSHLARRRVVDVRLTIYPNSELTVEDE